MFERFTDRSRRVLVLAQEEARVLDDAYIGTEHILLGLIREGDGVAPKALDTVGVVYDVVREKVKERTDPTAGSSTGSPPFTPRAKKVLELALREALQLGHSYIGTEHILLGLVREGSGVAIQILVDLGVELTLIRETVLEMMSSRSGPEIAGLPAQVQFERRTLREIVRAVGERLRPDLDELVLGDRTEQIAEDLFNQLRANWGEPGGVF